MPLTLLEYSQAPGTQDIVKATINVFAKSSDILRVLPFLTLKGGSVSFQREQALPSSAFRAVNEPYTENTGTSDRVTEHLSIIGLDIDVDKFLVDTSTENVRTTHMIMALKSVAASWSNAVVKGDIDSNAKEFDGLQKRLTGDQLIENSAGTGDPLSLSNLDTGISKVDDPTHILMPMAMLLRLTQAARNTGVGGYIVTTKDEFGRILTMYRGLPILIADRNADPIKSLAFDEAAQGGGSASTSIYVLSLQPGWLTGIQNGVLNVMDLGMLPTQSTFRTRVEWFSGIAMFHPRAAARIRGITDADIVA